MGTTKIDWDNISRIMRDVKRERQREVFEWEKYEGSTLEALDAEVKRYLMYGDTRMGKKPPTKSEPKTTVVSESKQFEIDALNAARELVNLSELTPFVRVLAERKPADSHMALAAMAAAMIAAFRVVYNAQGQRYMIHKSEAYQLMWLMVEEVGVWDERGSPKGIVDYYRLLDPDHDHEFRHELPRAVADRISEKARHEFAKNRYLSSGQRRRLLALADGKFPSFITIVDDQEPF